MKSPYNLYFGKNSHQVDYPQGEGVVNNATPSSSADVDELKKKLLEAEQKIKDLENKKPEHDEETKDEEELLTNIENIVNEN